MMVNVNGYNDGAGIDDGDDDNDNKKWKLYHILLLIYFWLISVSQIIKLHSRENGIRLLTMPCYMRILLFPLSSAEDRDAWVYKLSCRAGFMGMWFMQLYLGTMLHKGCALGLMFCSPHLEILNPFWTRGLHFHFALGRTKHRK